MLRKRRIIRCNQHGNLPESETLIDHIYRMKYNTRSPLKELLEPNDAHMEIAFRSSE